MALVWIAVMVDREFKLSFVSWTKRQLNLVLIWIDKYKNIAFVIVEQRFVQYMILKYPGTFYNLMNNFVFIYYKTLT
jgi:hypothetical protein